MARLKEVKPKKPAKPAKRRSLLRRLLRGIGRVILGLLIFAVLWVWSYRVIDPPGGLYLASEAWRLGGIERRWVDFDQISPDMARAVMAAEDARFCDHNGFDFEALEAALAAAEEGRGLRGASTLTQQVAKNVFLWHERSWIRKGLEAGFTVLIELFWPKQRILEVYLNTAEFAPGVFGAEAAAWHHFGRPAKGLSLTQASRLAAVLPGPKTRSASKPSNFVVNRARSIAAGAQTLKESGRAACIQNAF